MENQLMLTDRMVRTTTNSLPVIRIRGFRSNPFLEE